MGSEMCIRDREYGGVLYYRDVKNLPIQEYWQDMKFWWPHNEAIIATLLAYQITGDEKYAKWHQISVPLKGNFWKGPFHLPRMQLNAWKIIEGMG